MVALHQVLRDQMENVLEDELEGVREVREVMSRVGDENVEVPSASGLPSRTGPLLELQVAVGVVVPVLAEVVVVLEVLEEEVLEVGCGLGTSMG